MNTFEELLRAPRSPSHAIARHAKETGQSEWGKATASHVNWAYADASFFAEHGGQISVDCRQTSCKAAWEPPDTFSRDPAQADRDQALAEYELMAVVAKGGPDIGPIHTEWRLDEGNPRIEVYFSRDSTN
jgi:hypothetical protein